MPRRTPDTLFLPRRSGPSSRTRASSVTAMRRTRSRAGSSWIRSKGCCRGGDTGPAIVPGKPEKSLLIKAVSYEDEDLQMPPNQRRLEEAHRRANCHADRVGENGRAVARGHERTEDDGSARRAASPTKRKNGSGSRPEAIGSSKRARMSFTPTSSNRSSKRSWSSRCT